MLIAGPEGEAWCEAAWDAEVDAYRVGGALADPEGRFAELYGTGAEGAVLVRPDGFVAWRAREAVSDPQAVLTGVLHQVLARPTS